ncbi:enoyl-CoA hydratase/carnithine racemase [Bradyrhizobium sp. i1.4.4]|uniref:enoyl-CoA hydratase/isomerase family protein n=1 Tax=unclassified Bradyrhizobium TaxID=2631580 RepID=UPI003392A70B
MDDDSIVLEQREHIAVLTLNRPDKMNALTPKMRTCFCSALQQVQDNSEVRALVITGAGRGFCSGADMASRAIVGGPPEETDRRTVLKLVGDVTLAFENVNKPIIAAINGVAAGVGLSIALACDIRIAAANARFSAIWVKRGLIADGGASLLLPLAVGMEKALELAFTGDIIDAQEAQRIGLVSRVVAPDELRPQAVELAAKIANGPPISIELVKKLMWERTRNRIREQLIFESYAQNLCRTTQDQKEAVAAFVEKREPHFRGA